MTPVVVLTGPPGAGKTTVGRLLAERLATGFRDTDHDVEVETGESVADLFVLHGEAEFRSLERTAVQRALKEHDGVLAIGGGAVLDADTRALLREQRVVFLDVGLSAASNRIGLNRDRPLLLGNTRAQLKRLLDERRPLYVDVASATVATDDRNADAVADAVADLL